MNLSIEEAEYNDAVLLVDIYRDAYSENESFGLPASASKVRVEEVQDWIKTTILLKAKEKTTNSANCFKDLSAI